MSVHPSLRCGLLAAVFVASLTCGARAQTGDKPPDWAPAMRQVHERFKGQPGTLALFGDSITVSLAFWGPLAGEPKNMPEAMAKAHQLVKQHMKPECWNKWRGPAFGNQGRMTI